MVGEFHHWTTRGHIELGKSAGEGSERFRGINGEGGGLGGGNKGRAGGYLALC